VVLAVGWVCEVVCAKSLGGLAAIFPRVVQISSSVGMRSQGSPRDLDVRFAKFGIVCIMPRFAASALEMADEGGARKEMALDGQEDV